MADRNVDVKFRYLTDKSATNQLLRDQDKIEQGYEQIADAAKQTAKAQTELEHTGRRVASAQKDATDAQIRMARESAGIYGDVASRTGALSGLASSLGGTAVGGRLMIAADILDATEAAKSLTAEFPAMIRQIGLATPQAAAAAVAIGALVVAVGMLAKEAMESAAETQRVVKARIDAIKNYHLEAMTATADDAKAKLQALQSERSALLSTRADLEIEQKKFEQANARSVTALVITADKLGVANSGWEDINQSIKDTNAQLEQNKTATELWTQTLKDNELATRAAQSAAEFKMLWEAAGQEAAQYVTDQTELNELMNLSADEANKRIADTRQQLADLRNAPGLEEWLSQIQNTLDTGQPIRMLGMDFFAEDIEELADTLSAAGDPIGALIKQYIDLQNREKLLTDTVLPLIQARDKEQKVVEKFHLSLGNVVDVLAQTANGIIDTAQQMQSGAAIIAKAEYEREQVAVQTQADSLASEEKYQDERTAATADFEQSRADVEASYRDERTSIITEHQDAVADIEESYRDDQRRAAADFRRDQRRALEDHNDRLRDAGARLDAWAVLDENRSFTKDQRRAKEDFETAQKERQREYQQQLRDEQKAFADRLRQADQNHQRELQRLQQQYNQRMQQLDAAQRAELARIQQAGQQRQQAIDAQAQRELQQLFGFQTQEYTVKQAHYAALLAQLQTWAAQAQSAVNAATSAAASSGTSYAPGHGPTMHGGGYAPEGTMRSQAGEFVLSRPTTRALERGFGGPLTQQRVQQIVNRGIGSATINMSFGDIGNKSWQQIGSFFDRKLRDFVDGMAHT